MADAKSKSTFDVLNAINVNERTEQKNGLTYLSWAWAWSEVKKKFPDAKYEIIKFDGIPYVFDPKTGYMCYTRVTINNDTHEMWLPVMDSNNYAMKDVEYQVQTKYKTVTVKPATMTDINKTIMRCLTKNLAMHGLGLYIYAGEDLPEETTAEAPAAQDAPKKSEKTVCVQCGKEIKKHGRYTAAQIIEESTKRVGKPMCIPCWTKMVEQERARQAALDGEMQALQHEDAGDRV